MVTIATFNDAAKAKRLKERLQQSGLKADIHNEGHLQQVAFMSKPQANVKVQVDDNDFELVVILHPHRSQRIADESGAISQRDNDADARHAESFR